MLINLSIRNFAIIQRWVADFGAGTSVFTGETGSGKSLFVDALNFVAGARADRRIWHDESRDTIVEAAFSLSDATVARLAELGVEVEENTLVLRRSFGANGSQARIDQRVVTLGMLRQVAAFLLDIHSQNAQSLLADRKNYRPLLDQYAGAALQQEAERLQELLRARKRLEERLEELSFSPEEAARERDLLQYQLEEIGAADLPNLDEAALNEEYQLLTGALERAEGVEEVVQWLRGGEPSVRYVLQNVARSIDAMARLDASLEPLSERGWQVESDVDDLLRELQRYGEGIRIDPDRVEAIDEIFVRLQNLRRKYGREISDILAYEEQAQARLYALQDLDVVRAQLQEEHRVLQGKIKETAEVMHTLRMEAAQRLEARIREELGQMAIQKLSFAISLRPLAAVGPHGADEVDFLLSTNPGEPMHSVSEVASGGEMSRFMLAFKLVIADLQETETLVFDEIDTGISGRTAQVVGEKIARAGKSHQVLVITHLPQIAALADHHFLIRKQTREGETVSTLHPLTAQERIEEQARLIGGVDITETTRNSAREMIQQAQALRKEEGENTHEKDQ